MAAIANPYASARDRKLVVLGLPWDVDTEGLKEYMSKFGELDDVIVMKDRLTGRSRGFGYVVFTLPEDAQKVTAMQHVLNGRMLEVKVAIPKEEIKSASTGKGTRIFVARIPQSVTDDMFRSYFARFGVITDAYMPKEYGSRAHRGIGFVTFENAESVDMLMNETHELGGSIIAVDRATPKDEALNFLGKALSDAYMSAAAQFGAFGPGAPGPFNFRGSGFPNPSGSTSLGGPNATSNSWAPPAGNAHGLENSWAENGTSGGSNDVSGNLNSKNSNIPAPSWLENCEPSRGGSGASLATSSAISGNINLPGNSWSLNAMLGVTSNSTAVASSASSVASAGYSSNAPSFSTRRENKIFVGRLPVEATAEHLRTYFSRFGQILDVYVPKDASKKGHRGFGFVTFYDDGVAERVALESHEILGQSIAVDRPVPQDGSGGRNQFSSTVSTPSAMSGGNAESGYQAGTSVGSMGYGISQGNASYNNMWGSYTGVGPMSSSGSGANVRYRPY